MTAQNFIFVTMYISIWVMLHPCPNDLACIEDLKTRERTATEKIWLDWNDLVYTHSSEIKWKRYTCINFGISSGSVAMKWSLSGPAQNPFKIFILFCAYDRASSFGHLYMSFHWRESILHMLRSVDMYVLK